MRQLPGFVLVGVSAALTASIVRADDSIISLLEAPQRSVQELEAAVADYPGDIRTRIALAQAYLGARDPDSAIAVLKRAVETDPNFPPAHLALAIALNTKGATNLKLRQGPPRKSGDKNPAIDSTKADRWFDAADKQFDIAVSLDPDDSFVWLTWGKALLGRNPPNPLGLATTDPEPALEKLRTAYGLDPDDMETTKYLAGTLGHYGMTYDLFARRGSSASPPPWVEADVDIGDLSIEYLEESVDLYNVVMARTPDDVSFFKVYIPAMVGLGRLSEAVAACRRVMEAYPGTTAAKSAHRHWEFAIRIAEGLGVEREELKPFANEYGAYKRFLRNPQE